MLGGQDRSQRVPGSFRDPSGYVFRRDDRIFRAVTAACHDLLRALADAAWLNCDELKPVQSILTAFRERGGRIEYQRPKP